MFHWKCLLFSRIIEEMLNSNVCVLIWGGKIREELYPFMKGTLV